MGVNSRRQNLWGWILITPLTLGLTIWVVFPMGLSFVTSLTSWDMISPAKFVGFKNYVDLFHGAQLFLQASFVTLYYTALSVPLQLVAAFAVAMLLNSGVKGAGVFRTIFYLPSLIPIVVSAVMWLWLYNYQYGLLNSILTSLGIDKVRWISSTGMVVPSLVIMSLWTIGNIVIIFLAGLQGIPVTLMEAARIDGASSWKTFWHIVVPFMSPVILYNLIINIIVSLQLFTQPYIMTGGGPVNASLTFVLSIYNNAFLFGKMGMANAMAWMLFSLTLVLSVVIFRTSTRWTFYEGDKR